jgi:ubiquinone/menaquinone biosynthesis C-methylase UbiE
MYRDLAFEPGHGLKGFLSRTIRRAEQKAVRRALDRSIRGRPADSLLDVPCGTGKLASVVAGRAKRIVAADVSEAMMELARPVYATVAGFEGFRVADAEELPFGDGEFEVVVCLRLLHRVPQSLRRKMVRELARVSSNLVILSLGIVDPAQQLRSGLRQQLVPGTPIRVPCSPKEARELFEEARLKPFRARPILPMLSAEWVYAARKK